MGKIWRGEKEKGGYSSHAVLREQKCGAGQADVGWRLGRCW